MTNIENIMRDFVKTLESGDVEKELSFFADDAVWVAPEGVFKGKDELKVYLTWAAETFRGAKARDAGIGIITQGNKAAYEQIWSGIFKGVSWENPFLCAYEFSGEKIQHIRTVQDRLSLVKQVAKGWFAKKLVNSMVAKAEEGLR